MPFLRMLLHSFVLCSSCLLLGSLPMHLSLSFRSSKSLSLFGMGYLMGEAFAKVIPEALFALYSLQPLFGSREAASTHHTADELLIDVGGATPGHHFHRPVYSDRVQGEEGEQGDQKSQESHDHDESSCNNEPDGTASMGTALVLGFTLSLALDRLVAFVCRSKVNHEHKDEHVDVASMEVLVHSTEESKNTRQREVNHEEREVVQRTTHQSERILPSPALAAQRIPSLAPIKNIAAERERFRVEREKARERTHGFQPYASLISHSLHSRPLSVFSSSGLLCYALVDGVALQGYARSSSFPSDVAPTLSLIWHSAPTAFALVTFLMRRRASVADIRFHLFMLSFATPLAMLLVELAFAALLNGTLKVKRALDSVTIGLALFFAAGAYIYTLAMYVMPLLHQHGANPAVATCSVEDSKLVTASDDDVMNEELETLLPSQSSAFSSNQSVTFDTDKVRGQDLLAEEPLNWLSVAILVVGIVFPLTSQLPAFSGRYG